MGFTGDNVIRTLIALMPILWLLGSLGFWKMSAYRACLAGLALSMIIAVLAWEMPLLFALEACDRRRFSGVDAYFVGHSGGVFYL